METRSFSSGFLKILQICFFGIALLYFCRSFFIPISFAIFISIILYPLTKKLEQKNVPSIAAILLVHALLTILIAGITFLFYKQLATLYQMLPQLAPKLDFHLKRAGELMFQLLNIPPDQQKKWFTDVISGKAVAVLEFLWSSSGSIAMMVLVPVYSILFLLYRKLIVNFILSTLPPDTRTTLIPLLSEAILVYYNFIKGMLIVYLIVGVLNGTGLYLLGVPDAFLFGFIASVLTMIPYLGIMVGAILPAVTAWTVHDSIWYPLGVVGVFAFVQLLEANVIFPFAVGAKLKLNALTIIVVVIAGGMLWGIAGMILFIPFIAILKVIADKVPALNSLASLLGENETTSRK